MKVAEAEIIFEQWTFYASSGRRQAAAKSVVGWFETKLNNSEGHDDEVLTDI